MSTNNYSISPDLLVELDALAVNMESMILNVEEYEDRDAMRLFYQYKGFNSAISYMKALVHGYEDQAKSIRENYKGFSYEGFATDLSEEEEGEE